MADSVQKQIMVTVKKPDGTFVKVPLSELKKPASAPPSPKTEVPAQKAADPFKPVVTNNILVAPVSASPKSTMPVNKPKLSREDFSSPLEDVVAEDVSLRTALSRIDQAEEVMKRLSFKVPQDYINRLRSIVQLRLKDVRGERETKEMVLRSIKDGGLGLTSPQAEELLSACNKVSNVKNEGVEIKNIKDLKRSLPKSLAASLPMVESSEIPEKYSPPGVPANSTPFNSFVHDPKTASGVKATILSKEEKFLPVEKAAPIAAAISSSKREQSRPQFNISSTQAPRAMQDIVSTEKVMGPVEELKYVSLTDFRRLSKNPVEAAKRLGQKFVNLKEESYLLFLQALSAWRTSPLFQDYLRAVLISLQKGIPLEAVVTGNTENIQFPEIQALIEMEKELN